MLEKLSAEMASKKEEGSKTPVKSGGRQIDTKIEKIGGKIGSSGADLCEVPRYGRREGGK